MDDEKRENIFRQIVWILCLLPIGIGWAILKRGNFSSSDPPKPPTAAEIAIHDCQTGNGDACDRIGSFDSACDLSSPVGCDHAGGHAEKVHDYVSAARLYDRACQLKNAAGCTDLDALYMSGKAVPHDPALATTYYEKRCTAHDAPACALAGAAANDDARAFGLFQQACAAKDPLGCDSLGRAYAEGRGVAKSDVSAVSKFRIACDGAQNYCTSLARAYDAGKGVAKDHAKALALYTQACTAGNQDACAASRAP